MFINYNRGKGFRGGERGGHGSGTFGLLLFSVFVAGSRNRNRNEVGRCVWFRYERVSLDWLLLTGSANRNCVGVRNIRLPVERCASNCSSWDISFMHQRPAFKYAIGNDLVYFKGFYNYA
ncbi:hypothetical protein CDAR_474661 [Caerostris darwini]|uniref:Uncharacterized protein n=1 Tax=Caerostris darwini TaxID=1538125 RepID=A0AAV4PR02_9ARAC|nr:hypothetical protein CDAR_474661 [Caerostris darwini]